MAFLSNNEISARGNSLVSNYSQGNLQQASYDLCLGNEYFIVGSESPKFLTDEEPYLCLAPGQFALLTTAETLTMPNDLIAFISVKTQYKLQGLVNISGFHVDPTYEGTPLFAVQNLGSNDIRLKLKIATFTIFFAELTSPCDGVPRRDDKSTFFSDGGGISLKHVQMFAGGSVTTATLYKEVERLRTLITIYGGIAVSALIALIVNLIRKL